MKIFKELEQFNWTNPSENEINTMIYNIENYEGKLTEEEKVELADYLNELEDMKKQQEIDEELEYYDNNKDRLYYGVE